MGSGTASGPPHTRMEAWLDGSTIMPGDLHLIPQRESTDKFFSDLHMQNMVHMFSNAHTPNTHQIHL